MSISVYKEFTINFLAKKILSYSLFWKAPDLGNLQPVVTQDNIHKIMDFPRLRGSFFDKYVKPLLKCIEESKDRYPGWIIRIYLANELEFLIPQLSKNRTEIFLMTSNSINASPGALWRFLAFDDPNASCVSVRDSNEFFNESLDKKILSWMNNTRTSGWYRAHSLDQKELNVTEAIYSPIVASSFGAKNIHYINMEKAMKGFILHRLLHSDASGHPRDVSYPRHPFDFGNEFPAYGFDERFLKHVIYFEAARKGQLTTMPIGNPCNPFLELSKDNLIRMDLEFVRLYNKHPFYP